MLAAIRSWARRLSAVALVPGALFIVASVLKYQLGAGWLYDVTFAHIYGVSELREVEANGLILGGPVAAIALALLASMDPHLRIGRSGLTGTISLEMDRRMIAVSLVALAIVSVLAAYVVAENLPCVVGSRADC